MCPPTGIAHTTPSRRDPALEYSMADFIRDDCYLVDSAIDSRYSKALHRFQQAGPVFRRRDGQRVWFDNVDWDVQCGLINAAVRPIKDQAKFRKDMSTAGPPHREPDAAEADVDMFEGKGVDVIKGNSNTTYASDERSGEEGARVRGVSMSEIQQRISSSLPAAPSLTRVPPTSAGWGRKDSMISRDHQRQPVSAKELQASIDRKARKSEWAASHGVRKRPAPTHARKSVPHETLVYYSSDPYSPAIARQVSGVEEMWHPSKGRVSRSAQLLEELGLERACVKQPRLHSRNGLDATLGRDLLLGSELGNGEETLKETAEAILKKNKRRTQTETMAVLDGHLARVTLLVGQEGTEAGVGGLEALE